MNRVAEPDDANAIHLKSAKEKHTIAKELLSQSKEEELNPELDELKKWKSRGIYTEIEDKRQECNLFDR